MNQFLKVNRYTAAALFPFEEARDESSTSNGNTKVSSGRKREKQAK